MLERSGERVVAGFGVNLAAAPTIEGRSTTALAPLAAATPQGFAPLLADSVARLLALWRSASPEAFAQAWLARAHPVGTMLVVHDRPSHRLAGRFEGIDADGALRLRLEDGSEQRVRAGDVTLD